MGYFGFCPHCLGKPVRRDIGRHNFVFCDGCRTYWAIGYNLLTSYEQLCEEGDFDDDIGGPGNRRTALVEHDWQVVQMLHSYEYVGPFYVDSSEPEGTVEAMDDAEPPF